MKHQVLRVVRALCEDVGTPRALAVKLMCENGEWAQLQKLRADPLSHRFFPSYFSEALVTDLLRKCDVPTDVDKEMAAIDTFYSCEKMNALSNSRLRRYLPEHLLTETPQDVALQDFIVLWRKEIKTLLGKLPSLLTPRFSGGATYADTGKLTTIPDKMSSRPTIYRTALDLLPLWGDTSWARGLVARRPWFSRPLTVRGNVFFTVPKDGTKFRGCCKEASIPLSYQLSLGAELKKRLLRIGIDLKRGQQLHRRLAMLGSMLDDVATIDMSNASDTLCWVLVKLLFPEEWFQLLNSLRASHTKIQGNWVRLEKFSSMGNGFTFELETIVFATLARVLIRTEGGDPDSVKCYGDDLIVPSAYFRPVMGALERFGFEPNMKKTYGLGPFRESCGGDFFEGVPVRAHFLEDLPDDPQQWISLANGLRRVAHIHGTLCPVRWRMVRRAWLRCLDQIPDDIRRCRGPEGLGDIVIHDTPDNWGRIPDHKLSVTELDLVSSPYSELCVLRVYSPDPEVLGWEHWLPDVQLSSCTLGVRSDGVTPRGEPPFRLSRALWGPGVSATEPYQHRKNRHLGG